MAAFFKLPFFFEKYLKPQKKKAQKMPIHHWNKWATNTISSRNQKIQFWSLLLLFWSSIKPQSIALLYN